MLNCLRCVLEDQEYQQGTFNMDASMNAWAGIMMLFLLAGCASTGSNTNSETGRSPTQQRKMSGSDSNYPGAGGFSGESGRLTVYSSKAAKERKERDAMLEEEALPSTIEPGSAEAAEYKQWQAEQKQADYEAWKKEQAATGAAADTD
jgi:hypothetical protein